MIDFLFLEDQKQTNRGRNPCYKDILLDRKLCGNNGILPILKSTEAHCNEKNFQLHRVHF
jgi:hypothetical protein